MRVLLLCLILIPFLSAGQSWEQAELIDLTGNRYKDEAKWRKNIVVDEIRFRSESGKMRIPVDSINQVILDSEIYRGIRLEGVENDPTVLVHKISDKLYHGYFKEILCLCDNSFDFVEAYFFESNDQWSIIRKRSLLDRVKPDEDATALLGEEAKEVNFSDVPELLMEKALVE
jgi:hypothetical protein